MFYYSKTTNAFYLADSIANYKAAGTWPDDAKEIGDDVAIEFMGEPPAGQLRQSDNKGMPSWQDIPPLTQDEIIVIAGAEKKMRIVEANNFINSKQWPGKAALGRIKDDEKKRYILWLDYLDALDALDISTAPDIKWPEQPEK